MQLPFSPHSFSWLSVEQPLLQNPPGNVMVGTGPPPIVVQHSAPGTSAQSLSSVHGSPMSPRAVPEPPDPELAPEPPPLVPPSPPLPPLAPLPRAPWPPEEPPSALQPAPKSTSPKVSATAPAPGYRAPPPTQRSPDVLVRTPDRLWVCASFTPRYLVGLACGFQLEAGASGAQRREVRSSGRLRSASNGASSEASAVSAHATCGARGQRVKRSARRSVQRKPQARPMPRTPAPQRGGPPSLRRASSSRRSS